MADLNNAVGPALSKVEGPALSKVEGPALSNAEGLNLVVAFDARRGIGQGGKLPWKLSGDMRFFRELTTSPDREAVEARYGFCQGAPAGESLPWESFQEKLKLLPALPLPTPNRRNAVLMGRRTWDSLPEGFRPLPNRLNGVLSRKGKGAKMGTHQVWTDFVPALESLHRDESVREIFVIGGGQIYAEALRSPACKRRFASAAKQ